MPQRWPTPCGQDGPNGGPSQGEDRLPARAVAWGTPRVTTNSGLGNPERSDDGRARLEDQVQKTWPTPYGFCGQGEGRKYGGGGEFAKMVTTWPTPVVTDALGARNATSTRPEDSKHHSGTTLTDAIQPTVTVTKKTAARLNPRFVEWLMNWPLGWTGFAPVAMGSFLSRQRSRYEFFCRALGLSSEVPTMALRSHPNPDVQRILDKTGGKIVKNWLYELPEETMTKGFERLRSMIYWLWGVGAKEDEVRPFKGRPVPQEISEVMLWLRDHYGTDAERKAAMDRYMGLSNAEVIAMFAADYQARSQAPSAASTSPDSSSSGSA